MARYKFGVTGQDRKKLVEAISEILDTPMNYLGAPTFAYEIGRLPRRKGRHGYRRIQPKPDGGVRTEGV